ncbi:restriction endonuclease subunit S [Candidatus Palauibacter sp.]|uniref:restriction endonuclease subunit S n=1 Tax=Candidatus Palauibacter sp. TaxID=3101350 RepID=UPI003C6F82A3
MTALQPYPAYRDSGVEWLGEVPEHWEVERLRRCARVLGGVTPSMQVPSYWGGAIPWVTPKDMKSDAIGDSEIKTTQAALKNTSLRLIDSGAVLIVVRGMILAKRVPVAWTTDSVTINQDIKALTPVSGVDVEFLARALRSGQDALLAFVEVAGHGTRRLPTERWRSLPIVLPPLPEQRAIARFLDRADRRIRRFIRAKERLIELLEEQKQVTINEAVTGRINVRTGKPYPAYRDSGVKWLGKVPEHWEVRSLKYWLTINRQVLPEDTDPEYAFDYLDIGSIATGRLTAAPERIRFGDAPSRARRVVAYGDTIVSTVRTYLKAVWHAGNPGERLIASTGFAVLTPSRDTASRFVSYTCQSDPFTDRVTSESVGIAYPTIAEGRLGTFDVCVPPLSEQTAIARYLDQAGRRMQRTISAPQRQVELLREYRTRLIADVVTGKLDVREAAANLPEMDPIVRGNQVDTIQVESNLHASEHDIAEEAGA